MEGRGRFPDLFLGGLRDDGKSQKEVYFLFRIKWLRVVVDVILGDGVLDQVGEVLNVQFLHDVVPVAANREDADVEDFGNLLGFFPFRQQF